MAGLRCLRCNHWEEDHQFAFDKAGRPTFRPCLVRDCPCGSFLWRPREVPFYLSTFEIEPAPAGSPPNAAYDLLVGILKIASGVSVDIRQLIDAHGNIVNPPEHPLTGCPHGTPPGFFCFICEPWRDDP